MVADPSVGVKKFFELFVDEVKDQLPRIRGGPPGKK